MPKYIESEALLKSENWQSLKSDFDKARAHIIILGQPAADVVEVVRCKNCVFGEPFGEVLSCECYHSPFVSGGSVYVSDNDFCPYGIRREEDE